MAHVGLILAFSWYLQHLIIETNQEKDNEPSHLMRELRRLKSELEDLMIELDCPEENTDLSQVIHDHKFITGEACEQEFFR